MASIDLPDTDVVAVFNQHFSQRKGQAIHVVNIALQEEHAALLVADRSTVRQLGSRAKTVQNGFFVVVAGNTVLLTENP